MRRRGYTWLLAGTLALAAMAPAWAQAPFPQINLGGTSQPGYAGVATPFGYRTPFFPMDWLTPNYVFNYEVSQPIYVPVYVPILLPRPAVEAAQVSIVTLRNGSAPADVRVKSGTVVTWINSETRERTLVLDLTGLPGLTTQTSLQSAPLKPNANISVAFHRPGEYAFYLEDQPANRARIIVEQ